MEETQSRTKFCKYCGKQIAEDAVMCVHCGRQVENLKTEPNVIINNNSSQVYEKQKDKWVALILCIFLGYFGAHKFYEGKTGTGILYLFTVGLFGIGWIIDIISIACKPNPYYV